MMTDYEETIPFIIGALLGNAAIAQITDYSIFDKKFNFYVANDLGRNGYYDQKPIAELMGQMAENGADPNSYLPPAMYTILKVYAV